MALIDVVFRHTKVVSVSSLICVCTIALGAFNLEITPDNRVFYGEESTKYKELLRFEDQFEVNSTVVFAITSEFSIFSSARFREGLGWIEHEVPRVRNFVSATSVLSLPYAYSKEDELVIGPLLEHVCPDSCLQDRRELVMQDRFVGRLVSADARTLVVYAIIDVDPTFASDVTETQKSIDSLTVDFRKNYPDLQVTVTGAVPMMQAFVDTAAADSASVLAIAFVAIFVLLCIGLGSWRVGSLVFLTGALASLVSLGVAGWFGFTLNTATSIVPVVVFTLVVAGSMHLVVHFLQRFADGNLDIQQNIRASFSAQFSPMLLACITSCVSLLSLLWVSSPPIRELGVLAAVGVFAGFVLSFAFLGLLLPKLLISKSVGLHERIRRLLNNFAKSSEGTNKLSYSLLAFFFISTSGLFLLEVDDDFIRYFDSSVEFRRDAEKMVRLGAGSPYHIEIVVGAPVGKEVLDTKILNYVRDLEDSLRKREGVMNVSSIVGVLDDVGSALEASIPFENNEIASQLFLSYELSLPVGQSSASFIDSDHENLRVSVLLQDVTSKQTKALEEWIYSYHQEMAPAGSAMIVTGENIPVAHLSQETIGEMLKGLVVVLLFVALVLSIATRRAYLFFVGLAAIAIPISAGFGIWGWVIGYMGLSAAIILAVTIGVVIDDAIHLVYRYEDGRRELALDPQESASYAIHKTGPAIVTTSVCLSLGFALMYFSSYAVNQVFGLAACLIFALAMLFDLIVLPKLLALQRFS